MPAYDESSVPEETQLPYITYSAAVDSLDAPLALTANIWYRDTSWETISKKADEISERLKNGGATIELDVGYLWLTRGSPFAQRGANEENIKQIYIVLMGEYLTE